MAEAVRDEVIQMVMNMSERSVRALRPLAEVLVNVPEYDDDAFSDEDMQDLMQSRKMWKENPESFITIDEFMESRGISPE